MNRFSIPGVAVGVFHGGREFTAGLGVTSIENPLPVTADTLFQIGSITKTFVATAVLRLVETGKIELDSPVCTYLPELTLSEEEVSKLVTMRHLLTHTGGWVGDYFNDFGRGEDALAKMIVQLGKLDQISPLGEIYSYNNAGFYIAGRVLEVIHGTSFETAIQELVFEPLGMDTSFFFAEDAISRRFVVGHEVVKEKPKVARPWAVGRSAHPAGGIISNAKELLRYSRFHMRDKISAKEKDLLSTESLELMQTPVRPATGTESVGLSWFITKLGETNMIGHGGGTLGQVRSLRIVPSRKFALVSLTNSDRGGTLNMKVLVKALKQFLDLELPQTEPKELPEKKLLPYVGKYDSATAVCKLSIQGGKLILEITEKGGFPTPDSPPPEPIDPLEVSFYDEDKLIILDEPLKDSKGEFLRDRDNNIVWFRIAGRVHARLE